jgi:hypothetical protein
MAPCVLLCPHDGHKRSLVGLWLLLSVSARRSKALPHRNPEDILQSSFPSMAQRPLRQVRLIGTSRIIQADIANGTITTGARLPVGTPL